MKVRGNSDDFAGDWSELDAKQETDSQVKNSRQQFDDLADDWGFDSESAKEAGGDESNIEISDGVVSENQPAAAEEPESNESFDRLKSDMARVATDRFLEKEKIEHAKLAIAALDECLDQMAAKYAAMKDGGSQVHEFISDAITSISRDNEAAAATGDDHWRNLPSTLLMLEGLKGIGKKTCVRIYEEYPTMGQVYELFEAGLHHAGIRGEKGNRVSLRILETIEEIGAV